MVHNNLIYVYADFEDSRNAVFLKCLVVLFFHLSATSLTMCASFNVSINDIAGNMPLREIYGVMLFKVIHNG